MATCPACSCTAGACGWRWESSCWRCPNACGCRAPRQRSLRGKAATRPQTAKKLLGLLQNFVLMIIAQNTNRENGQQRGYFAHLWPPGETVAGALPSCSTSAAVEWEPAPMQCPPHMLHIQAARNGVCASMTIATSIATTPAPAGPAGGRNLVDLSYCLNPLRHTVGQCVRVFQNGATCCGAGQA